MLNQIPLNSHLWNQLEIGCLENRQTTQELLLQFAENPDTESELFLELHGRIFDSNTCLSVFYLALPYLIDIADKAPLPSALELWAWLGSFLAEGVQRREDLPAEVLTVYEEWLHYGAEECLNLICQKDISDASDLPHLLATPLAMINPAFGYVSSSAVKDDMGYDTELAATCPKGHICSYTLTDSEISNALGHQGTAPSSCLYEKESSEMAQVEINIWTSLSTELKHSSTANRLYADLAQKIGEKGITANTPVPLTLILYGCLLEHFGLDETDHQLAQRCFHLMNIVTCPECGEEFIFADGWREYTWLLGE